MDIIICITKEDVTTYRMGTHYEIRAKGLTLNFTKDAIEELYKDMQAIDEIVAKEKLAAGGIVESKDGFQHIPIEELKRLHKDFERLIKG